MLKMETADINLSKSIIKKKKVSYLNDQFHVHSGAGKIISDFLMDRERARMEEEKALQALSGGSVSQFEEEIDADQNLFEQESVEETLQSSEPDQASEIVKEKRSPQETAPRIEIDYSGMFKQEYDKGFEAGKRSAIKILENEFKKKLSSGVREMSNLIEAIKNEFDEYKLQYDKYIISLSISIAEKIIKREVIIHEDTIIMQIKDAINKVLGVENITIHLNPKDEELLRAHKNEIMNKFDSIKEFHIHANDKIERGGCKIESHLGNVDARIMTQLKIIEEALLENINISKKDETD